MIEGTTSLLDPSFWKGRHVFVTGHMGFKGTWLCYLLSRLGAYTIGFGRDRRERLLYRDIVIPNHRGIEADINDTAAVSRELDLSGASILLHLAAQPIVLSSYDDPLGTFRDNVLGTASVLQAARGCAALQAIVVVTSDKVYQNKEWKWAYRETEPLGGHDPYSASKAAAEIITSSMVQSFFSTGTSPSVATARAGNVIGGGDWADFRLLPDAARAFGAGGRLELRNPQSTRPWQHVLEPLIGYLQLAQALVDQRHAIISRAWNFGPIAEDSVAVGKVADIFVEEWGGAVSWFAPPRSDTSRKEASFLAVDPSLAMAYLDWAPRWRVDTAVRRTARWYRDFLQGADAVRLMDTDIDCYFETSPGASRI